MALDIGFTHAQIMRLQSTAGFPDSKEGRMSLAEVLSTACVSEKHAEATIDECRDCSKFCPTPYDLREIAFSLRSKFAEKPAEPPIPSPRDLENIWKQLREMEEIVPIIDGVRWETCLQIQTIRIDLGMCGTPPDYERIKRDERDFPEAVAAIRAGRLPDIAAIERVLEKRIPRWNQGAPKRSTPANPPRPITNDDFDQFKQ